MIAARDDFPFGIADELDECRAMGLTFDEAWRFLRCDRWAGETGYGRANREAWQVESPLTFAKRHLRAAYDGTEALRYCEEDCPYLAVIERHCGIHATEGIAA